MAAPSRLRSAWASPCVEFSARRRRLSDIQVAGIIPEAHNGLGLIVLEAQNAYSGGADIEIAADCDIEPAPAGGQDAQEMPAGKEQCIPSKRLKPGDDPVSTA